MFARARMLFKGHPASRTIKPANALRPSNLHESNQILKKKIGIKSRLTGIRKFHQLEFRKELKKSMDLYDVG